MQTFVFIFRTALSNKHGLSGLIFKTPGRYKRIEHVFLTLQDILVQFIKFSAQKSSKKTLDRFNLSI